MFPRALTVVLIEFSDDRRQQLEKAFPTGVCDWSKPGIDQQGAIPWQTYQDPQANVVYGGKPLGPSPRSQAVAPKRRRARRS